MNADQDEYVYSGYRLDQRSECLLPDGSAGFIIISFGVNMCSSVDITAYGTKICLFGLWK